MCSVLSIISCCPAAKCATARSSSARTAPNSPFSSPRPDTSTGSPWIRALPLVTVIVFHQQTTILTFKDNNLTEKWFYPDLLTKKLKTFNPKSKSLTFEDKDFDKKVAFSEVFTKHWKFWPKNQDFDLWRPKFWQKIDFSELLTKKLKTFYPKSKILTFEDKNCDKKVVFFWNFDQKLNILTQKSKFWSSKTKILTIKLFFSEILTNDWKFWP